MTEPTAASTPTPTPTPAPTDKSNVFDDLVEITFAPTQVFARREKAGFGAAFFIIWLLMTAVAFASRPVFEPIMQVQMDKSKAKILEKTPNATADQLALGEKIGGYAAIGGIVLGPPIAILILGVFVWLVAKLFGSALSAGQGMLVATYAMVPRFLGELAVLGLSFVMDSSKATSMAQLSLGPARFLDPASTGAMVGGILSRIDVSILWGTAVIAVGYAVIGKMDKGKAWGAAIVLWILGAVPVLLGALQS